MLFGIMGREKGKGKFKPFDYGEGQFVTNIIYQTLWENEDYVLELVSKLNEQNKDYEFKVINRK